MLPLAAGADDGNSAASAKTYVAPAVYQAAKSNPRGTIHVIIQNASGTKAAEEAFKTTEDQVEAVEKDADAAAHEAEHAADDVQKAATEAQSASAEADRASAKARRADRKSAAKAQREADRAAREAALAAQRVERVRQRATELEQHARDRAARRDRLGSSKLGRLKDKLNLIGAVSVEIPAGWVYELERLPGLIVTLDSEVEVTGFSATQLWAHQAGASLYWGKKGLGPKPPRIAIVDSGIDKSAPSFGDGSRVVRREVFTSLPQDSSKPDGRGHGTFVAGIAAGEADGYAGVAPQAELVDLDVMDDRGMARTSDVIKACEWILAKKDELNIRVANFSLHSASVLSIKYHPLNKAVERLWFGGVVVVAAAGNYGNADGTPSGVVHAPGNDPFVITVGAFDLEGSARISNHDVPFWSAYGYTNEGFAKPDLVAAGRYLVGPAPVGSAMGVERPERVVAPGYMKLSGTSFSAPIVAGMAAQLLAYKPSLKPDEVKGALMMSGRRMPDATLLEQGRGEVNLVRALAISQAKIANPNKSLNQFVVSDPNGGPGRVFDASAFYTAVKGDAAWDSAAWQDAAWSSAAWQDAAWMDAAWQDAAWQDAAWMDAAWQDATAYEDNAAGEPEGAEEVLDSTDQQALATDPELAVPGAPEPPSPEVPVVPPAAPAPPAAEAPVVPSAPAPSLPSAP